MPDGKARTRKRSVETFGLTVLEKEIFRPGCSFCPKSVALGLFFFQSVELEEFFFGNHLRVDPTELRETPTRHARETISFASPRPTYHQTPITDSMRSTRRIVQQVQSK